MVERVKSKVEGKKTIVKKQKARVKTKRKVERLS